MHQARCSVLQVMSFRSCSKLTGAAPVIQAIDIEYSPVHFNGSLFKKNAFRLDAGPKVDEAWESLGVDCELLCLLPVPADVGRSSRHCT